MSDGENNEQMDVRRSGRRRGNRRMDQQKSALEELKMMRETGKKTRVETEIEDVYDEVPEEEYQARMRERQESNFVVDDDGSGYVDHGGEIFDDEDDEYDGQKKKGKKNKNEKEKPKKGTLQSFLAPVTKAKAKNDTEVKLDDDDTLNDILADIGNNDDEEEEVQPSPARNPFKRRQEDDSFASPMEDSGRTEMHRSTMIKRSRLSHQLRSTISSTSSSVSSNHVQEEKKAIPSPFTRKEEPKTSERIEPQPAAIEYDDDFGVIDDDSFEEKPDKEELKEKERKEKEKMEQERKERERKMERATEMKAVVKTEVKSEPISSASFDEWTGGAEEKQEQSVVAVQPGQEPFYCTLEEGGKQSIRMYWLDAFEDDKKHSGEVYLFGRVNLAGGRSASCCVAAKNIHRQIFVLPRIPDDGAVVMAAVYQEVNTLLMKKYGAKEVRCKTVKRRFINDGTADDPKEDVEVLEVQYASKIDRLPTDTTGKTFTRIFNTTTTAMERLLIECGMKGPGWIDVTGYVASESKVSFCQYEFAVDFSNDLMGDETQITFDANCLDSPPHCRMFCINVVTALNQANEPEIVALSCLFNPRASLTDPSTAQKDFQSYCYLTRPPNGTLPIDMKKKLEIQKFDSRVKMMQNEKALLVSFLNSLCKEETDPDFFVGHDLQTTISLLMARCEKHKIAANLWSRLSRLRRTVDLKRFGHSKAAQWEITAGRCLLDSRSASMEMVHSRNYDLTELVSSLLSRQRMEILPHEVASKWCTSSQRVIELVNRSWLDCHFPLCVLAQIQALPLFTRITNICGGVLSRTLMGGRSERNEFLLLHAFHKEKLVAPDKYQHVFKKDKKKAIPGEEGTETQTEEKHPKGAQYSGGLVLEPRKGLYDTLILLLDFNSLYPSIIQEYNICFTTIRHNKNGDELPDPPSEEKKGILPAQIESLVSQRSYVKKVMANERNQEKKKQYDIRQKALKLTANSMYGCLGFAQSRFYAKPLAALVTAKGREILMETKDLVERLGHEVIYGDTDSIMVNTGDRDEERAKKIAKEVTDKVNKIRTKLDLEHEGTFKRMLLLKKKKYAALVIDPSTGKEKKELKGLDIVRRDWSMLAKDIGAEIVDLILDPSLPREELVAKIAEKSEELKKNLDEGTIPLEKFAILKSLTRDPSKYEDVKQQPHAAVAKRMNQSGKLHFRQGDIVEYAICEDGTSNGAMQRAYHRLEMEANADLKIDVHYYLAQQVHPVISRLCAPLEELDAARIAETIGLDASHYRRAQTSQAEETPAADWRDNFEECEGIKIRCPECGKEEEIREMLIGEGMDRRPSLESCSSCSALYHRHFAPICNQIRRQLSSHVEKEQMAAFVCDDVVCAYRMRSFPLRSTRDGFECPKCRVGVMHKEYSIKQLFDQQTFLWKLLDLHNTVRMIKPVEKMTTITHRPHFQKTVEMCEKITTLVDEYLSRNSYNIVDMHFLFAAMMA